jgi:hypothetical protein
VRHLQLIALSIVLACLCSAADDGAGARYAGGTVSTISSGSDGKLRTTDELFLEFRSRNRQIHIPYDKINLLEYGQSVNRRLALAIVISPLFMLSKARRHFLTIGYAGADGRQQAMVFQIEKSHIRAVLVSLEARTGLKVQYQDDEARKAGKG